MSLLNWSKRIIVFLVLLLVCSTGFAADSLFQQARTLQREGRFDEAIEAYKRCLVQPVDEREITDKELFFYTESLVQLMNTYQSKGDPEACVSTLQDVFNASPVLQNLCLRDYYSVLGYALSRTEDMKSAEETMMKVFTLPLHNATPERYFRDYAYAAAVFYSNPNFQTEVVDWCNKAIVQAQLCENTSGVQWVKAMLGSLYKKNGQLDEAIELYQQSKEEAQSRNDDLGVLNSLHSLVDLFLYWDIPEYANIYASEAVHVEKTMKEKNPMVSAQTYINKGRALHELGRADSVLYYAEHARKLCQSLPYNSGMVDVDLLHGCVLTQKSGDSLLMGINKLQQVTQQGTTINRVRAYDQLARTYLRNEQNDMAEVALDSMYMLLNQSDSPVYLHLDYEHILDYYLKTGNHDKVEKYVRLMLQEQRIFKEKSLNFNLVCSLVDLQTEKERHQLKILQLHQKNQRLWILIGLAIFFGVISVIVVFLFRQKRYHIIQMRKADERFAMLAQELNQSNVEKEKITQEIREFLKDHDNRQELETLTPFILKEEGEVKFRQCFELLYPLFLPRLREKVPSITRREELLSMLIVLKQDNKEIAELLAIAPRSVLMLRHRFRQKIGMATEYSLENFIEDTLGVHESVEKASEANSE